MTSEMNDPRPSSRAAGYAIGVGSLLILFLMAHHPTAHARGIPEFLKAIQKVATLNGIIHGSMIAVLGLLLYGYWGLTSRPGLQTEWARIGLIAYALGTGAMILAALVNGFILSDYLSRHQTAPEAEHQIIQHTLSLCRAFNQISAKAGVIGMSMAVLFWSLAVLRCSQSLRIIAAVGIVAALGPVAALFTGHLRMTVHGVMLFVLVQALWSMAIAIQLVRKKI